MLVDLKFIVINNMSKERIKNLTDMFIHNVMSVRVQWPGYRTRTPNIMFYN